MNRILNLLLSSVSVWQLLGYIRNKMLARYVDAQTLDKLATLVARGVISLSQQQDIAGELKRLKLKESIETAYPEVPRWIVDTIIQFQFAYLVYVGKIKR